MNRKSAPANRCVPAMPGHEARSSPVDDQGLEALLEDLEYDFDYEGEGCFRILAATKSEAECVSERVSSALSARIHGFAGSVRAWKVGLCALDGVPWADFGEDLPVDAGGAPVPYAVVVACPWRPGGTELLEDHIDHILDDHNIDFERISERTWRLQYGEEKRASPTRLVERLKRTLGWWECYGLTFVAIKSGSTIHLEIKDRAS